MLVPVLTPPPHLVHTALSPSVLCLRLTAQLVTALGTCLSPSPHGELQARHGQKSAQGADRKCGLSATHHTWLQQHPWSSLAMGPPSPSTHQPGQHSPPTLSPASTVPFAHCGTLGAAAKPPRPLISWAPVRQHRPRSWSLGTELAGNRSNMGGR